MIATENEPYAHSPPERPVLLILKHSGSKDMAIDSLRSMTHENILETTKLYPGSRMSLTFTTYEILFNRPIIARLPPHLGTEATLAQYPHYRHMGVAHDNDACT